ncbi:ABC transporter ATP-binding protein [Gynuella sp.]|uniref:ABC transporter ATP-binding protein n=1 Tax=Gynuella sp. TaxID=2969146 RepID=UPI003D0A0F08
MQGHHPRLSLWNITKRYPGCIANQSVSLSVQPGEIHALLGENGAGKSTLMKIIYGVTHADEGSIIWEGKEVDIHAPTDARKLGIGMVFQHFSLFETLSVAENIALAYSESSLTIAELSDKIVTVSQRYGMPLEPDRLVHTLSVGERQRLEIIRCLIQDVKLLILDEPTSVLTPQEADSLFDVLRALAAEGCSILFISHKLNEVKALCHKASVLRQGKNVGEADVATATVNELASLMVGAQTQLEREYEKRLGSETMLALQGLSHASVEPFGVSLKNLNMEIRAGEILGIAGVAGNGQEELFSILSGEMLCQQSEQLTINGRAIGRLNPAQRRSFGMAYVPPERNGRGAIPEFSLEENGLLTSPMTGVAGWLKLKQIRQFANQVISTFGVKCHHSRSPASSLSGGNLQKFIIGREILQQPKVLIAAHPTWGVDFGSAKTIHEALIELRNNGTAVVIISEDLDELFQISDRMSALFHGRLAPVKPTTEVSIDEVGRWMAGVFDQEQVA